MTLRFSQLTTLERLTQPTRQQQDNTGHCPEASSIHPLALTWDHSSNITFGTLTRTHSSIFFPLVILIRRGFLIFLILFYKILHWKVNLQGGIFSLRLYGNESANIELLREISHNWNNDEQSVISLEMNNPMHPQQGSTHPRGKGVHWQHCLQMFIPKKVHSSNKKK